MIRLTDEEAENIPYAQRHFLFLKKLYKRCRWLNTCTFGPYQEVNAQFYCNLESFLRSNLLIYEYLDEGRVTSRGARKLKFDDKLFIGKAELEKRFSEFDAFAYIKNVCTVEGAIYYLMLTYGLNYRSSANKLTVEEPRFQINFEDP